MKRRKRASVGVKRVVCEGGEGDSPDMFGCRFGGAERCKERVEDENEEVGEEERDAPSDVVEVCFRPLSRFSITSFPSRRREGAK